jgi:phosphohistidine phosphatase
MPAATRQLFVLRHAKSSWDDPGLGDHDRPLAARGRRAAAQVAGYLQAREIDPELVLCSSARRTRETLEGISPHGQTLIEPQLYAATASDLIERLRRVPDPTASVMLIGHNPGLQMLVLGLAAGKATEGANLAAVSHKFPTAALATLELTGDWSELRPGGAVLSWFVRPKDLPT